MSPSYTDCRSIILSIAQVRGIPLTFRDQLYRVVDGMPPNEDRCTMDEAARVAYVVYKLLRPPRDSHQ